MLLIAFAMATLGVAQERQEPIETLEIDPDGATPEVDVKEFDNRKVEEFRVNTQLYKIKVTPKRGDPYYLVDPDGSGTMEWRRNSSDVESNIRAPQWTLFEF